MDIWPLIVILILIIVVAIFVYFTYSTQSSNAKVSQNNVLYPFSGTLNASQNPSEPVRLINKSGQPQIACKKGYKVNIVGAWVETNDPFGQCSNTPSSVFKSTCGYTKDRTDAVNCRGSQECGDGMVCDNGKCMPSDCAGNPANCGKNACNKQPGTACKTNADCGGVMSCVGGTCQVNPLLGQCMFCNNDNCAQAPTCSNLNSDYQNTTCEPAGAAACRPRDASAYLAKHCNGKQVCDVVWNPLNSSTFGPLPCKIQPGQAEYLTLPVIPGWDGSTPTNGEKAGDATFKQGYYVHGIYTCIPDDE
ncbi:hypothetical protein OAG24_01075 [bacterium]|nr:hypothetical protein [bacterium]